MEIAVEAYGDIGIADFLARMEAQGVQEHGFPRLTTNLAILMAQGRMLRRKDQLKRMMDISCRDASNGIMPLNSSGNEFSVKELAIALCELEKAEIFPKDITDKWRADLKKVNPYENYSIQPELNAPLANNWCIFGCASEQARICFGLDGRPDFVEKYVSDQLRFFDVNGMYRDPDQPAVYDFVTRLQFAFILHCGYDGPSRRKLEDLMDAAAEPTLKLLSACGEIPYGGRSNQFLHNNAFYSALCEWYALRCANRNDMAKARAFREAALLSLDAITPWLKATPLRHVKNLYPRETGLGCEQYAYFDKYMITMGSWAMLGWFFLRDNKFADAIAAEIPSRLPDTYFATSPLFHLVTARAGEYSVEFDYDADEHYDCDGLGRIHRTGAPVAICMSCPCTATPYYTLPAPNDGPLAIMPIADAPLRHIDSLNFTAGDIIWKNDLTPEGLSMHFTRTGNITCVLPAFTFDGMGSTVIQSDEHILSISYKGWTCHYTTDDGIIRDTGKIYANRNGQYRRFEASSNGNLTIKVTICKN